MIEPIWIADETCIAIHRRIIDRFGGLDAGVRDENLFQAALARPLNKWHYDEPKPDLFVLAAAYGFGLAKGHVFHDGNKRTAYVVAVTFLAINGIECAPTQADIIATMVGLADGSVGENDLALWFRRNRVCGHGMSEPKAPPIRKTGRARR